MTDQQREAEPGDGWGSAQGDLTFNDGVCGVGGRRRVEGGGREDRCFSFMLLVWGCCII